MCKQASKQARQMYSTLLSLFTSHFLSVISGASLPPSLYRYTMFPTDLIP